jgi:MFS family permease
MEERSDEGTVEIPQDINNIAASPSTGTEPKSKDPEQITGSEPIELVSLPGQNTTATEVLEEGAKHAAVNDLFAQTERHLQGWRLYFLTFGLCLSLLLSTLETTIISTALVSISNAMGGFQDRDWVVTSYLLTYTGFLVIYAKFSDIFGAKFMMLLALLVFTVFSVACGAATGMTELIVLRSFQGLGASGIYSMVGVVTANVIPPSKFSKYMAVISSVFAVSSVLGPVLGGAITQHTTWRWVFLLNAPGGAAALGLIIFTLPSDFSAVEEGIWTRLRNRFTISSFKRLDLIGSGLMLAASILLVFALEEAGSRYAWASGVILGTLLVSVVAWAAFVGWEILIDKRRTMTAEPIFPMRLLKRRVVAGMLLYVLKTFLSLPLCPHPYLSPISSFARILWLI